jgi:hypothetical protein
LFACVDLCCILVLHDGHYTHHSNQNRALLVYLVVHGHVEHVSLIGFVILEAVLLIGMLSLPKPTANE